jgi:hypothetical protein
MADASGVEKEHIGAAHLEKILGGTWKADELQRHQEELRRAWVNTDRADIDAFCSRLSHLLVGF